MYSIEFQIVHDANHEVLTKLLVFWIDSNEQLADGMVSVKQSIPSVLFKMRSGNVLHPTLLVRELQLLAEIVEKISLVGNVIPTSILRPCDGQLREGVRKHYNDYTLRVHLHFRMELP